MDKAIDQEIIRPPTFIVGMARSGTTLAQSLVGSHSYLHTFPETHLFDRMYRLPKWQRSLRKPGEERFIQALRFLKKAGFPQEKWDAIQSIRDRKVFIEEVLKGIDEWTIEKGKHCWLGKTPLNLRYISTIEKYVREPDFIHIIRNPIEASAALWEAAKKFDEFQESSLEKVVMRCKTDVKESTRFLGKNRHHFLIYEDLVKDPERETQRIWKELGLPNETLDMERYYRVARSTRTESESWKANNTEVVTIRSSAEKRLGTADFQLLTQSLSDPLKRYDKVRNWIRSGSNG